MIKKIPGIYELYCRFNQGCGKFNQSLERFSNLIKSLNSPFLRYKQAGHFYSPLPDINEIVVKSDLLFNRESNNISGINLQEREQLELLDQLSHYYNEVPFSETPENSTRYFYQNVFFSYGDSIILYSLLRHYRPRQIIEVGSGYSSAVMLDVNDLFLDKSIYFTFIEPYPNRLLKFLNSKDKSKNTIIKRPLQEVSLDLFMSLNEGDILFIDSSHVVKIGSDVAYLFFNIFPRLKSGVIIHIHDIFWPFEYPREWYLKGRAWNEAYFLRAFLQFNDTFEIVYFNSFMAKTHFDIIKKKMPLCLKVPGASLWIKKLV